MKLNRLKHIFASLLTPEDFFAASVIYFDRSDLACACFPQSCG